MNNKYTLAVDAAKYIRFGTKKWLSLTANKIYVLARVASVTVTEIIFMIELEIQVYFW